MFALTIAAVLGLAAGTDDPPITVKDRYEALSKEYEERSAAYSRAIRGAKTGAEKQEVAKRLAPDKAAFAARFLALAKEEPTSPVASDALFEALQLTSSLPTPEGAEMLAMLHRGFVTSPKMGNYLQQLSLRGAWAGIETLFRDVLERNPDRTAKGHACLGLAFMLSQRANLPRLMNDPVKARRLEAAYGKERLAEVLKQDPEANLREATALYERVVSEFADVKYFPTLPDVKLTLGIKAERWLGERRDLAIGMTAPEVEGRDVDGKAFKLSDYRGKVVALVFWASWCGPCMAQVPHERELARSKEGKPFALLGVNCDSKVGEARAVMAKEKMAWPNWYDGDRKIANRYHLEAIPAVFILDAKGVIREKDVRGEALERAVEALLIEQDAEVTK